MKRGNVHRGINLLLAVMLLALGLYPVGAVSAQGPLFLGAGKRAVQAETTGSIRYVKPNGSTTGECQSWDTACDLQTALEAAINGDELWVAEGIYTPGQSGVVAATFQLKGGVEIYGGFAGDESALGQRSWTAHPTILSGDIDQNDVTESGVVTNTAQIKGANAYRVVSGIGITNTALLDGFTITAGYNDLLTTPGQWGGGMYVANSKITIRNVTFRGNYAAAGGGLFINGGLPGQPGLENVVFSQNHAGINGGGLHTYGGSSPTLTDVTFSGNLADNRGGGMYNEHNSSPSLINVTMSSNSAGNLGGGLFNDHSNPHLTNITMSVNSAGFRGGGMYNAFSSPSLTNVTISGNSATSAGGAIYNDGASSPNLTNAILWGNTPAENQIINEGTPPAITYSDIQLQAGGVYTGTGNINGDPLFVDAAGGNLRLQSTSPAIDAGDNAAPGLGGITTDLDGSPRFVDVPGVPDTGSGSAPIVDMGAYEVQFTAPPTITSTYSASFTEGVAGSFTVTTAEGVPPETTISESGALPGGVSFTDNGDGTATLSGMPASGTSGTYNLTITASNGIPPDATQDFTLNVLPAPLPYTYTFLPLLARH